MALLGWIWKSCIHGHLLSFQSLEFIQWTGGCLSMRWVWGLCEYLFLWCVYGEDGILNQSKPVWVFASMQLCVTQCVWAHDSVRMDRQTCFRTQTIVFVLILISLLSSLPMLPEFTRPEISKYFKHQENILYFSSSFTSFSFNFYPSVYFSCSFSTT